ncbi:MAG: fused MFS/spermidine synthase [Armatimonadota bacterium]|nr:fused MFS/spermidine synthase [Armatimonadota bacterium]
MQTELVGARALTPYFGNSIFVWGSVIAVFLLALAVGYGAGGRLTRRCSACWIPALVLAAAGGLVAATVAYQDRLNTYLTSTQMDVRWGALLASVILYAPAMVLSGMVAPYLVHLATSARAEAGSRAGALYAVSTIGSFAGSLVTAFVLIPAYSLNGVAFGGGIVAAAAGFVCAAALSMPQTSGAFLSAAFAVVCLALVLRAPHKFVSSQQEVYQRTIIGKPLSGDPPSTLRQRLAEGQRLANAELKKYTGKPGNHVLLNIETPYQRVQVTQEGDIRLLTFGEAGHKMPQTSMNLRDITHHSTEYTGLLMAPILYKPDAKRVLLIGLGGGDVARGIETCYPEIKMDVVEIDPAVVSIAQKYFFWKPSRNVTVYTMDGRSFINTQIARRQPPYDWIILDAFDDQFVPFHMTTLEFYSVVQRALAQDGVLAVNTWINHDLYSYQARTIQKVFRYVDAYFGHRSGNVVLVAQNNAKGPMTLSRALDVRRKLKLRPGAAVDLKYITTCLLAKPNWNPKGDILTDTWAPVERLLTVR